MLPQLRKIEQHFGPELVLIGVHAGKFIAERVTDNIRQAVLRLEIEHPVVNDRQFRIWKAFTVNAWPTLVVIDPLGRVAVSRAGELPAEALIPALESLIAEFEARGAVQRQPLPLRHERNSEPTRALCFPAKVIAGAARQLWVADTGHHRLLGMRISADGLNADLETVIGCGTPGLRDGSFPEAAFHHPHGLALDGATLFVADLDNHVIREIDLVQKIVRTVAGTGAQAGWGQSGGPSQQTALSSPWDLAVRGPDLFIAMAGAHQLWRMDRIHAQIEPFAGSGREDIRDASTTQAALAQPSGLALAKERLYFADTEASGIRWADLSAPQRVHTIVGTGLFDFGDVDGVGDAVRLEHPQGVAWHAGRLFVADTYNHKIKVIDPVTRRCTTLAGFGAPGLVDGPAARFFEPGGLCVLDGQLYIADTNNHAVRVVSPQTGQVETLRLHGL